MSQKLSVRRKSRREFLKNMASLGTAVCVSTSHLFSNQKSQGNQKKQSSPPPPEIKTFPFKYKTFSVEHLKEVKEVFEKLEKEGKLSNNPIYMKYIKNFKFEPPETLPNAKSVILMAIPLKIAMVTFHMKKKKVDVMIPPGYVDNGLTAESILFQLERIVGDKSKKLERVKLPLKSLTARSGLGEYGKNNITFIDGMGSYFQLLARYTDQTFAQDDWGAPKLMRICKGCYICMKGCTQGCIREENFVIDAGKCVSLYNELPDPMPSWINPKFHNSIAGCWKCQYTCPANLEHNKNVDRLEDVTEAETDMLISGKTDKKLQDSVMEKFKRMGLNDYKFLSRNIKLVLDAMA